MKLFILVDQMAVGGAGRVASIMLNGLAEKGYEILLETDLSMPVNYDVNDKVSIVGMEKENGTLHRIQHHRRLIKQFRPDCIIAYLPTMFLDVWLATLGMNIPIIASDHTAMDRDCGRKTNFIRHYLYGLATTTTILTEKDRKILGNKVKCKEVVYNPLTYKPISSVDTNRSKTILCAGRINYWKVKGFDRIIKIWGNIAPSYPDWTLEIAGPGDENGIAELNSFIKDAHVENRVKLLGNISDMQSLYRRSSIFALPSRVEGFPMVLLEAMSQGCACVTFDFGGAITEIANNNRDCLIVEDNNLEKFEKTLVQLIENENQRIALASHAIETVRQYSVERFINKWEELINDINIC